MNTSLQRCSAVAYRSHANEKVMLTGWYIKFDSVSLDNRTRFDGPWVPRQQLIPPFMNWPHDSSVRCHHRRDIVRVECCWMPLQKKKTGMAPLTGRTGLLGAVFSVSKFLGCKMEMRSADLSSICVTMNTTQVGKDQQLHFQPCLSPGLIGLETNFVS
jgi:hypothetical protein